MTKVPHIQELPYLESEMRKKLDGFTVFNNGQTEENGQSLESKLKYDFRKSLAWDSAFFTSSGILEVEELFDTSNTSWHSESGCDMLGPQIKTVTDEFNLRKSLAWDSSFFTSEGILNPEELSLLNKGPKKFGIDMLPQIEELWISSDSNCTIDSDEVLVHQSREALNTVSSSSRNIQKVYCSTKMNRDCVYKLKVKSRPISTMQTINDNQPKMATREQSVKFSAATGIYDLSSHPKPPKISRRVRGNPPIASTKRVPQILPNEVNGESKMAKESGKCLTEKPNMLKNSSDNNMSDCTTLSWEFSSLRSKSCVNGSNGLCSPYNNLYTYQSCPEFSVVKNDALVPPSKHKITNKTSSEYCCHQTCSSVKKSCCCKSPLISIDGLSLASSPMGESNSFHDDKGIMCSKPCSEVVKGSNSVSFDASKVLKPSGLRMPSPKIAFFDVDNLLLSIENICKKSHSKAVPNIQSGQKMKGVENTRTCASKTRNYEGKNCLRNHERIVNAMRADEPEFERQTCAKIDKREVGNKMLREREEQSCLNGRELFLKEQTRRGDTSYKGNDPHTLHKSEKENLIGFENKPKEQVRTHDVCGDVVIEF